MTTDQRKARAMEIAAEKLQMHRMLAYDVRAAGAALLDAQGYKPYWNVTVRYGLPGIGCCRYANVVVYDSEIDDPAWKANYLRRALEDEPRSRWARHYLKHYPLEALLQ